MTRNVSVGDCIAVEKDGVVVVIKEEGSKGNHYNASGQKIVVDFCGHLITCERTLLLVQYVHYCTSYRLPINRIEEEYRDMFCLETLFIPSPEDVERYKRSRQVSRKLNRKIVKTIPRKALFEVGKAIGIAIQGNSIFFESDDQTSVLMD